MPESCAYVAGDTAESGGVELYEVSKGKSSLMIYEQFPALEYKYRIREFWRRRHYVDTAGKNAMKIAEYIPKQLEEHKMGEQLTMSN